MEQDVVESLEGSIPELVHRASAEGSLQAWIAVQHRLQATVLGWLRAHPARSVACTEQDEQSFVTLVFEEAWPMVLQGSVACDSLSQVLLLLRANLNAAIIEAQRVCSCTSIVGEDRLAGRDHIRHCQSQEVWLWLQARLLGERERRLTYLLYHCGLQPTAIVRSCPQEWSDIHEVISLRRIIISHLLPEASL